MESTLLWLQGGGKWTRGCSNCDPMCFQFLSFSMWKLQSILYSEHCAYYRIRSWNPGAQLVFISDAQVNCDNILMFPHVELTHP